MATKVQLEAIELALSQIKTDVIAGDLTAIEELLFFVPVKNLLAYLPEEVRE